MFEEFKDSTLFDYSTKKRAKEGERDTHTPV